MSLWKEGTTYRFQVSCFKRPRVAGTKPPTGGFDVKMMGFLGAGNNSMVGMTISVAVAVEESVKQFSFQTISRPLRKEGPAYVYGKSCDSHHRFPDRRFQRGLIFRQTAEQAFLIRIFRFLFSRRGNGAALPQDRGNS